MTYVPIPPQDGQGDDEEAAGLSGNSEEEVQEPSQGEQPSPEEQPPSPADATAAKLPPEAQGEFILRLTLVQENVAWFDTLDEGSGFSGIVRVGDLTSRPELTSESSSEPQLGERQIDGHLKLSLFQTGSDSFISTG